MKRVTGLGGVFFKCEDRDKVTDWYRRHLGLDIEPGGYCSFEWRDKENPDTVGHTVWSAFARDTDYFDPSDKPFMINYRVGILKSDPIQLTAVGIAAS